jgi:plastocyanin
MLNGTSENIVMKLLLLLSITSLPMAAFILGEYANGFPLALATTSSSASSQDSSFVAAIITITEDAEQNTVFTPETTNITRGDEVFIGNNSSSPQSITSGTGPEDPLSGKLFDTGVIKSKGYAEFVTANLSPGSYPYYSSTNPSAKGLIFVQE